MNILLGDKITKEYEIDYINGDRSDNRLENLRKCTHQENMFNIHKDYKTVGVGYHKWNGIYKWVPTIMVSSKSIWLGVYDSEEDAIKARKEAEKKYFNK